MNEKINPIYYEEWKNINIDEVDNGKYQVSNFGRVRNNKDKIIKPVIINSGYSTVRLFKSKENRIPKSNSHRYKQITVHRLVMKTFSPNDFENKLTVNHKDGDKLNNYITNLEWMTQEENNIHSFQNGLNKNFGDRCHQAILSNEQVVKICQMLQDNKSCREIIDALNLEHNKNNNELIYNIKRRIAWKWISKNYTW